MPINYTYEDMLQQNKLQNGNSLDAGNLATMLGDPVTGMIIKAVGNLGGGIGNAIKTAYSQNITDPNVAEYMMSTSLFDNGANARKSLQSNIQDLSNVNNNTNLLNTGINQVSNVNDPTFLQNYGKNLGSALESAVNLDVLGVAGAAKSELEDYGARLGLWDSRADKMNKEINRINQQNVDNFYNQVTANNKRQQRQAMMNYFAEGGSLEELNGVTKIGAGNTHEQNPNDGVQIGIAPDNLPNLVEENEVVYKDYVYSNRLKPSKTLLKQYNLPEKYTGKTFAELAEILQKESEDRPNDPVSLQTLEDWMSRLTGAQEEYKAKQAERKLARAVDSMSDEEKAVLLSSLEQPMAQQEGIDLSQPMYKSGGKIYIKPENRGKFTASAKRAGMGVQEFARHILANKEDYSSTQVKRANFARNFGSHKHAEGGYLIGQTYDVSEEEYNRLKQLGYEIEIL